MIAAVSAAVTAPQNRMFGDNANALEECVFLLFVFLGLAWWGRREWKCEEKGDDKRDAVYYEAQRKGFRSPQPRVVMRPVLARRHERFH